MRKFQLLSLSILVVSSLGLAAANADVATGSVASPFPIATISSTALPNPSSATISAAWDGEFYPAQRKMGKDQQALRDAYNKAVKELDAKFRADNKAVTDNFNAFSNSLRKKYGPSLDAAKNAEKYYNDIKDSKRQLEGYQSDFKSRSARKGVQAKDFDSLYNSVSALIAKLERTNGPDVAGILEKAKALKADISARK